MKLKAVHLILSAVLCVHLFAPMTSAQTPASSTEGWRFRLTPYLWAPGFDGRVGIGERQTDVDASFRDLFKHLKMGFTGVFEADRNRFVALTDVIYLNLDTEKATPGPLFSSVKAIQKSFVLDSDAGFRIVGSDAAFVDVIGGIRFWHVNAELEFRPGVLPGTDIERTRNWVDGTFALRGKWSFSPVWYISGYGDIGGGGSNLTYQ